MNSTQFYTLGWQQLYFDSQSLGVYELSGAQYPLFNSAGSDFYSKISDVADIDGRYAILFTDNGKGMQILKQGFFDVRDTRRLGNRVIIAEG